MSPSLSVVGSFYSVHFTIRNLLISFLLVLYDLRLPTLLLSFKFMLTVLFFHSNQCKLVSRLPSLPCLITYRPSSLRLRLPSQFSVTPSSSGQYKFFVNPPDIQVLPQCPSFYSLLQCLPPVYSIPGPD